MKNTIKQAFIATLPVMTGYLVLGFGFGIIMKASGYGTLMTFAMSLFIYAGSMQYAAVGLFTSGASLLTIAVTTVMVNARHLFYGISMLNKYRNTGKIKPYLIFGLTDETYSLVCREVQDVPQDRQNTYYLLVTLFDHLYWVSGCVLGAVIGSLVSFNSSGIDFALTALFVTIFIDQWLNTQKHAPAITGLGISLLALVIFGRDSFLIPAMIVITCILCLYKEV